MTQEPKQLSRPPHGFRRLLSAETTRQLRAAIHTLADDTVRDQLTSRLIQVVMGTELTQLAQDVEQQLAQAKHIRAQSDTGYREHPDARRKSDGRDLLLARFDGQLKKAVARTDAADAHARAFLTLLSDSFGTIPLTQQAEREIDQHFREAGMLHVVGHRNAALTYGLQPPSPSLLAESPARDRLAQEKSR